MIRKLITSIFSIFRTIYIIVLHSFKKRVTLQYPEESVYLSPRYRGRIVLTRDNKGKERCVACNLCAVVCPVDCICLQKGERQDGIWYPLFFRINFSRCIFCGLCEEACPTSAIQLTPDFELGEYKRQDLVFEKEDLLISGTGKDHYYNFYEITGISIIGKGFGKKRKKTNECKIIITIKRFICVILYFSNNCNIFNIKRYS